MGIRIQISPPGGPSIDFYGRPMLPNTVHNPGSHLANPDYADRLLEMAPKSNTIFYSTSDHTGQIMRVNQRSKIAGLGSRRGVKLQDTSQPLVKLLPGDGILCHKSLSETTIALRTCDCIPLIVWDDTWRGAIHVSNSNLTGYHRNNFNGSILKLLFKFLTPKNCHVIIGPAIGGMHSENCWHYEYTEKNNQHDGSHLVELIWEEYPSVNIKSLTHRDKGRGKMSFKWGEIILEILKSHGVDPKNIHAEHNMCTVCNHHLFYSQRVARIKNNLDEMNIHYGNIALVRIA